MGLNVEKVFLASARNHNQISICHLEPFGQTQGKLRERSFPNGTITDIALLRPSRKNDPSTFVRDDKSLHVIQEQMFIE